VLELGGKKAWAFHGDVFDVTMKHSKWLAKLGAVGYDTLILLNKAVNYFSKQLGRGPISMSKKIKNSVKSAVKFINNFEETAVEIARENDYDYVVCGHIHQPEIRDIREGGKPVTYLNSGDWVENLTSLEYHKGSWRLYHYMEDVQIHKKDKESVEAEEILDAQVLFEALVREMQIR
jgi:UDP-2,3-diacylglucosamine pyrophosphatase LpxH